MICYKNRLKDDSIDFALRISDLCENINGCSVYINKILLSSSLIGAYINETKYNNNKVELVNKYNKALEECLATEYWIELIFKKGYIEGENYKELCNRSSSIRRRLLTLIAMLEKNIQSKMTKE